MQGLTLPYGRHRDGREELNGRAMIEEVGDSLNVLVRFILPGFESPRRHQDTVLIVHEDQQRTMQVISALCPLTLPDASRKLCQLVTQPVLHTPFRVLFEVRFQAFLKTAGHKVVRLAQEVLLSVGAQEIPAAPQHVLKAFPPFRILIAILRVRRFLRVLRVGESHGSAALNPSRLALATLASLATFATLAVCPGLSPVVSGG